jgi:hypothetical protein
MPACCGKLLINPWTRRGQQFRRLLCVVLLSLVKPDLYRSMVSRGQLSGAGVLAVPPSLSADTQRHSANCQVNPAARKPSTPTMLAAEAACAGETASRTETRRRMEADKQGCQD